MTPLDVFRPVFAQATPVHEVFACTIHAECVHAGFHRRLKTNLPVYVIVETKGYDPLAEVRGAAADRWVKAVNAEGSYGRWAYAMARKTPEVRGIIERIGPTRRMSDEQYGRAPH
jgi:hypothetical protein